jgi:hypothetical protein
MPSLLALVLLAPALAGAPKVPLAPGQVQLRDLPAAAASAPARVAESLVQDGVAVDLVVRDERTWRGRTRLHLQQAHGGVPVIGGGVVAQVEPDGGIPLVQGRVHEHLMVSTSPALSAAGAQRLAVERVPRAGVSGPATLHVLPDGGAGRLVWRTLVPTAGPEPTWRVLVDAHDGTIRVAAPFGAHAVGRVFGNRAVDEQIIDVDLEGLPEDAEAMEGGVVRVRSQAWDGEDEVEVAHAVPDEAGDFIFEPDHAAPDDAFAEVNAWWHATRTHAYFADVHGHDLPDRVDVLVNNTGSPGGAYDNAFFTYGEDGRYTLTFGQGADMDWSYDPGIVIHEFGHGIVNDQTGMLESISYPINMDEFGLHPAPGGLTEGLPDYWSTTRNDRSTQAEFADGTPIRDSDNDATCPDSILGEAHQDGVVVGGTTWEIREALGAEATDQLVYGATGLAGGTPTYAEFAAALVVTAEALVADGMLTDAELDTVATITAERGLTQCGRAVPVTADTPAAFVWLGADLFDASLCDLVRGVGVQLTPPFQLEATVPAPPQGEEITGLVVSLEATPLSLGALEEDDLQYSLVGATGELVRFEVQPLELLGSTFMLPKEPANAAWSVPDQPTQTVLQAGDIGSGSFAPGEQIYLTLAGMNCRTTNAQVSIEWETSATAAPPVATATGGGGCGGKGAAAALLLPFGLLGLRRRVSALTS